MSLWTASERSQRPTLCLCSGSLVTCFPFLCPNPVQVPAAATLYTYLLACRRLASPMYRLSRYVLLPYSYFRVRGLSIQFLSSSDTMTFFHLVVLDRSDRTSIFFSSNLTVFTRNGSTSSYILPPSPNVNQPSFNTDCTCHQR
jgi:hypothetical protein